MEQRIRGHFSEAQCLVVILEKLTAFVVKMAKISYATRATARAWTWSECMCLVGHTKFPSPSSPTDLLRACCLVARMLVRTYVRLYSSSLVFA
jgi:hypothetical protein